MRVMILEDDIWIADLLRQIVQGLRPHAMISSMRTVSGAHDNGSDSFSAFLISTPANELEKQRAGRAHESPLALASASARAYRRLR
jgi:hypothetical protein